LEGRLNLFQRMMLRWRELHPYNPVHAVRVPAPLERARLQACIDGHLEALGLTGLVLDLKRWRYRYDGGPARAALAMREAGGDPLGALSGEIEREFNTPFPAAAGSTPFRFVAVDSGSEFYLALAYDHFVAGGDAIALVLKGIAERYVGGPAAGSAPARLERYPPTYRSLLLRHPFRVLAALAALPGMVAASRRAFRPRYGSTDDQYNAFKYFSLGPRALDVLRGTGKAWGVTFNDLLIASALRAFEPFAAERAREPRRRELAVASIVNIRDDLGAAARATVSPFLASFRISHPVPAGIGLRELVAAVHAETARVKARRLDLLSLVALAVSALMWPFLSPAQRARFYVKYYPAWAGVTALNVNALWGRGEGTGAPFDYLRAVPTGPLCPMVFAVTTVKDVLHVGVAYRTAVFSSATVDQVTSEFVRCLESLDEGQPA
jgi:hypothetical protein